MKARELRGKSNEELMEILKQKRAELFKKRFEISQKKVKNVKAIRNLKKDIARILTNFNKNKKV